MSDPLIPYTRDELYALGPLGGPGQVRVSLKGRPLPAALRMTTPFDGARPALNVAFDQAVALVAGDELVVVLALKGPNPQGV